MDPHMQISRLVVGLKHGKHSPGPGRNVKPITFSEQPIGSIIPQQQVTKGCLMSCRQRSLPEAPNGQMYIPWCLRAFVLEKPLQALWVLFWRQLPWQVRGGREGVEKKGFPLQWPQDGALQGGGRTAGEVEYLNPSSASWGSGSLGSGQMDVSREDGEALVTSSQLPRAGRRVSFGGSGFLLGPPIKDQLSI